jgi:hypothetical protein
MCTESYIVSCQLPDSTPPRYNLNIVESGVKHFNPLK